jgi:osmoprotectant transport system ATP-binding protein
MSGSTAQSDASAISKWCNTLVGPPAIEFVEVSYRTPRGVALLDRFSLAIHTGEVLALVGRSGAGKTTILKLINRLLVPSGGSVRVAGRDTQEWDPVQLRRSIGYVIQEVGLFPHLSVADNIAVVPRLERWSAPRVLARVSDVMGLMNLPPSSYADRWPDELSGGQRQRVGVARALAADPAVLLMDEPFGALDPLTRTELHGEFRKVQTQLQKTTVIVTHDMGEALALADRIAVIEEGALVACASADVMLDAQDPRVRRLLEAGIFSRERWLAERSARLAAQSEIAE